AGATTIPWDGPRVEIVEHLAHAPGHAALLVPGSRTLVAGDMLSDLFVPMLDDPDVSEDPVAEYLAGLDALATVADRVDVVVPGQGSVGTGAALRERVAADRAYVLALRDGRVPEDRRLGAPDPGWEWVADIHAGQAARFGPRRLHAGGRRLSSPTVRAAVVERAAARPPRQARLRSVCASGVVGRPISRDSVRSSVSSAPAAMPASSAATNPALVSSRPAARSASTCSAWVSAW